MKTETLLILGIGAFAVYMVAKNQKPKSTTTSTTPPSGGGSSGGGTWAGIGSQLGTWAGNEIGSFFS